MQHPYLIQLKEQEHIRVDLNRQRDQFGNYYQFDKNTSCGYWA